MKLQDQVQKLIDDMEDGFTFTCRWLTDKVGRKNASDLSGALSRHLDTGDIHIAKTEPVKIYCKGTSKLDEVFNKFISMPLVD